MKTQRFEALRRRFGAKLGVVTPLVASAREVHAAEIRANTASSLPESASSLAGRLALVSSPAGLWACSGGSWC